MIRMIVTDLDQTALREDGTLSEYTKNVFKRCSDAGILVGIATARVWVNAVQKQRELGAKLLISSNGSRVMFEDELIDSDPLDAQTVKRLTAELSRLSGMQEILMEGVKDVYINTQRFKPPHPLSKAIYQDFAGGVEEDAFQIFAGIASPGEAERILKQFPQCRCLHYRDSLRYAFLDKQASKERAVERAAERFNIPLSQVAAFGDDEGDMGLLSMCGMGVAMGNALPEVKKIADAVTGSNEEDGVAAFLERTLLRG